MLLAKLGARELVLTGVATDSCILATAVDAHMREFTLRVPRDCVAALTPAHTERALTLLRDACAADVRSSRTLRP